MIDSGNFDLLSDIPFQPRCSQLISAFERSNLNLFCVKLTLFYYYCDSKLILKLQYFFYRIVGTALRWLRRGTCLHIADFVRLCECLFCSIYSQHVDLYDSATCNRPQCINWSNEQRLVTYNRIFHVNILNCLWQSCQRLRISPLHPIRQSLVALNCFQPPIWKSEVNVI